MSFSDLTNRLSTPALKESAEKGMRAMARLRNMSLAMKEQAGQTIQTLEVNAACFGWGFARGYFAEPGKELAILGVPMDAAAGVLGHALALFGNLGKYSEDFHNLADGSLASYTTTLGLKLGVEQRNKPSGPAAAAGARSMSIDELVRQAAAAI